MQSDALTLYKLIILFMLDKVDFPLTNAQLSDFLLEREYTNYFNIQQAISELSEAELITEESIRNSTHYRITTLGRETLEFFNNKISDAIKEDILQFYAKNRYSLRDEVSNIADYMPLKNGEYSVTCQVKEKDVSIINLTVIVPTLEEATAICNNWKEKSQAVYSYVLQTLLKRNGE